MMSYIPDHHQPTMFHSMAASPKNFNMTIQPREQTSFANTLISQNLSYNNNQPLY